MGNQVIENRPGYKKTKLGWIPEDWEVNRLNDFCEVRRGAGSQYLDYVDPTHSGAIRLIRITDFINNDPKYILKTTHTNRFLLKKGDLLIAGTGATAGITFEIPENYENLVFSYNAPRIRVKKNLEKTFLIYALKSQIVLKQQFKLFTGNAQPFLDTNAINNFQLPIPSILEQKIIANCLSTWETAITKFDELIKSKLQFKKALIQQLLSGERRLPKFDERWVEKRIEDLAKEYSKKNDRNEDIEVLSCTKYDGLVPSLEYFGRQVFGDDLSKYKIVPHNYFAYATNHIEEGSIGYQDFNKFGLVSPMYTVFKTDETIDDVFFFKVLKSHKLIHEYNRRMEGSIDRRGGLRWKNFKGIKMSIPPKKEQTAIAQVLNTADQEINLLTTKRNRLQLQQKGLMQQLITGKKRLSV